ncbi:hypothetical protein VCSRO179_3396 [Vibrio cholerae]|nr:hypothetical protein VCSRO179_3396 [Vibrio cholerae]
MAEVILRQDLLKSFQALQSSFQAALTDAKQINSEFEKIQKRFSVRLAAHIRQTKECLPESHPLTAQIDGILSALSDTDKAWQENLNSYDKGLAFRKNFQDSLLVFVFGKVKSGKSSLGNYMAWGQTDPIMELKDKVPEYLQPEYFTADNTQVENGDAENEAIHRQEFRVGAIEATSSIQGFRLPGLTWVDSPGLHSVNGINGQLAQEYVDHADLILYTMRSDAPGRASDMMEIRELKEKKKEILILVTGSDINEDDWDDELDTLVTKVNMKSEQTRLQQREYIANQLDGIVSEDIVSLSARYAQEHHSDAEAMKNSGITQLFSRLSCISQNHGVQVKRSVPLKNFSVFLGRCLEQLQPYKQLIDELDTKIKNLETSVPKVMTRYSRESELKMSLFINQTFDELERQRNNEELINQELRKARCSWNDQLQQLIGDALERGLAEISHELKNAADKTWHSASLELPNFSIEKVTEQVPVGFKPSTKKRGRGIGGMLGSVVGGVSGFLIGGPAGAFVGASAGGTLGGMAGGAYGEDAQIRLKTIELNVGDNLELLKKQVRDNYVTVVRDVIKHEYEKVLSNALVEMRSVTQLIKNELDVVNIKIEELQQLSLQKIENKVA